MDLAELGLSVDSRQMREGSAALDRLSTSARRTETATERLNRETERAQRSIVGLNSATRLLVVSLAGVAGAIGGLSVGRSIAEFASFEQGIKNVGAVSGATAAELTELQRAALQAAASTRFNPRQATQALYSLASAGQSATQQIATLPNVLNLAEAAQADLGQTTELMTSTLAQFRLGADQSTRVADVFTASIGASALNVNRLQVAFRNAGPTASALNQSLEGTTAVLGMLTTSFGNGERAGTGFRALLNELPARAKDLGVSLYGADGAMRPFVEILADLEAKGLTGARAVREFGAEAGPALAALLSQGSEALRAMESRLASTGQAAATAGSQLNTLQGDIDAFKSAVSVAFVEIGQAQSGSVRGVLQTLTNLTRYWSGYADTLGEAEESTRRLATAIELIVVSGAAVVIGRLAASATASAVAMAQAAMVTRAHSVALVENAAREAATATATLAAVKASEVRAAAEMANVRALVAATRAEIELEKVRYAAQISETGRAMSINRMAAASQAHAAATVNLTNAERALTSATAARAAAQAAATAATNAATAAATRLSFAAGLVAKAVGGLRLVFTALGGWVGIAVTAIIGFVMWLSRAKDEADDAGGSIAKSIRQIADEAEALRKGGPIMSPEQIQGMQDAQERINKLADVIGILEKSRRDALGRGDIAGATQLAVEINRVSGEIKATADDMRRLQDATLGYSDAATDAAGATGDVADAVDKTAESLRKQIALLRRENELIERGRTLEQARFIAAFEAGSALERQQLVEQQRQEDLIGLAEQRADAEKRALDEIRQAEDQLAENQRARAEQVMRAYERMAAGVEDVFRGLYRSVFDGFDSFTDQLKRSFQNLLVELALIATRNSIIIPIVASIGGGLGLPGLGGLTDALSLGGDALGIGRIFSAGNFMRLGDAFFERGILPLADVLGNAGFESLAVSVTNLGGTLAPLLSAAIPALAGAGALFGIGSALATPGGRLGSTNTGIASVLAPAFALPLAGLDRLAGGNVFGTKWKTDGQALLLQVVDDMIDATVETYRSRKRSFGRGTKRSTEVDEALELDQQLGEAFGVIYDSIVDGAESIGLAAGQFNLQIKESLDGLTPEQVQEVIGGALSDATEALIRNTVPGIEEFRQRGEELTQTFQRVVGGVQVLQGAIDMFDLNTIVVQSVEMTRVTDELGSRLGFVVTHGEATTQRLLQVSDALTQLAGGAEALQANIGRFFDLFASDEQKIERTWELTRTLFKELGMRVPETREDVFALVQGLDIFSEAGREAFNTLTGNADLLNAYYANLERDASEAARVAQEAADLAQRAQMERLGLEQRLAAASGDAALAEQVRLALLDQQRWALDETNRALFDMVVAAETAAAALSVQVQLGIVSSIDVLSSSLSSLGLNAQAMIAAAQGGSVALATYVASLNLSTDAMASLASVASELVSVARTADTEIARSVSFSYSTGGYSAPARDTAADDRLRLERELLMLLGDTAELRRRELQGLSASNQALQLRIWAIEDERIAMQTAESALRDAFDFESRMLRDAAERFRAFGDGLREFVTDLRTGPQALLTPEQQYAALRDQFAQTSALAAAGDEAALQSLAGISRDFLDASRSMFASGDQYFRDFAEVESAALAGAGAADFEVEINERQLEAMQTQVGALVDLNTTMKSLQEAIRDFIKARGDAQSAGSGNSFAELIELTRAGVRLNTQQQKALNESIQELSQRLKLATV
jgi:TP901 family phage tail tape measure protein